MKMIPQQVQQQQAQAAAPAQDPRLLNLNARNIVLANSQEMVQQIYQQTLTGTIPGQIATIQFKPVGLVKRFYVRVTGTIAQAAAETLTQTPFGVSNVLGNVTLTDLSNVTRIQTQGWHLHQLATVKRGAAFGAAFTNDSPVLNSNAFTTIKAPASVTTAQPFQIIYEIPVTYSDQDLRGAIWANVVNATAQLQLQVNPSPVAASTGDPTLAMYQSSTAGNLGVLSNVQITVHQVYLDQIPRNQQGQAILPMLDLSTNYYLNNSQVGGLVPSMDNPLPYSNFREFYSTMLIYDNGGQLNAGTDINRFKMQTANQLSLFDMDVFLNALQTRNELGNDMPRGAYYFNHRKKPINTIQYGNMQLLVNPSVVNTGGVLLIGYESMGMTNMMTQAGSLYGT